MLDVEQGQSNQAQEWICYSSICMLSYSYVVWTKVHKYYDSNTQPSRKEIPTTLHMLPTIIPSLPLAPFLFPSYQTVFSQLQTPRASSTLSLSVTSLILIMLKHVPQAQAHVINVCIPTQLLYDQPSKRNFSFPPLLLYPLSHLQMFVIPFLMLNVKIFCSSTVPCDNAWIPAALLNYLSSLSQNCQITHRAAVLCQLLSQFPSLVLRNVMFKQNTSTQCKSETMQKV